MRIQQARISLSRIAVLSRLGGQQQDFSRHITRSPRTCQAFRGSLQRRPGTKLSAPTARLSSDLMRRMRPMRTWGAMRTLRPMRLLRTVGGQGCDARSYMMP